MLQAIRTIGAGVVGGTRNSAMTVTTASASANYVADEVVVKSLLGKSAYTLASLSKTINLATVGAGGMDTGIAPANGFVALYVIYNPATGASAMLAVNSTSSVAPEIYGGVFMPFASAASALVGVWPTNASRQLIAGFMSDRKLSFFGISALITSTGPASYTALSIAGVVPPNAKRISGNLNGASSAVNSTMLVAVASDATGMGSSSIGFSTTVSGQGTNGYVDIGILTPQTLCWRGQARPGLRHIVFHALATHFKALKEFKDMTVRYIQCSGPDHKKIISIFSAPQNEDDYPNRGELEDNDPLLIAYLESIGLPMP